MAENITVTYDVYARRMMMSGIERYEESFESEAGGIYPIKSFDNEADARKLMEELSDDLQVEVIHTKRGLDSIVWDSVWVDKVVTVEEEPDWWYEDSRETICMNEGITDELRAKAKEAERSYWAYLDWKTDSYHGIE